MLEKMKYKLVKFMEGRYGMDDLAKAESGTIFVLLIVSVVLSFFGGRVPAINLLLLILEIVWIALFIHMYFRVFSRNISKRYEENQKFCNFRYRAVVKKNQYKNEWAQRKTHCFFRCPQCKQRVRVPKGRGKICITCPKCRNEFTRRS